MLGMYVHTHWAYNHPYAARTWTFDDWNNYLAGLQSLGYDFVMLWPQLDCMPAEPNASDRAFLARIGRVIDLAHDRYGMRFVLTACPNTIGNDKSPAYAYEQRPYFITERKVDPRDAAGVQALLEGRRRQFEPIRRADGLVMIDSDPGGYIGSTNAEFVALMKAQIDVFRSLNPNVEMIYWMWVGWETYNRFWAAAAQRHEGDPEPQLEIVDRDFAETLALMQQHIPEPWSVFSCNPVHHRVTDQLGLAGKRAFLPYGLIEGEPTFPLTNYDPQSMANSAATYSPQAFPHGTLANAQTHVMQLPHTYLFAHLAKGGTLANADLAGFAEDALPGHGAVVAQAWQAIGAGDAGAKRAAAECVRAEMGKPHPAGKCSGLLFGDADRFLADLAANLHVRADLDDLKAALDASGDVRGAAQGALRILLAELLPYQHRLGFVDAYGGPLYARLNQQLARLNDTALNAVLGQFHDWKNPSIRNGILPRLLHAIETYCR